jgi:hypothetical protein
MGKHTLWRNGFRGKVAGAVSSARSGWKVSALRVHATAAEFEKTHSLGEPEAGVKAHSVEK